MTKREYFEELRNVVLASDCEDKDGAIAFIDHEVELLNRKSSRKTMTATQKANVGICDTICEVLTDNGGRMTVTEMMADSRLDGLTSQKISALVNRMANEGRVVKITEKKRSYFSMTTEN